MKDYTLCELFGFFDEKYPNVEKFHVLKSLTYYEDAEVEPALRTLKDIDWETVKKSIRQAVQEFSL